MPNLQKLQEKLAIVFSALEDAGLDEQSFKLSCLLREVQAAATDDIEVTSWDSFQRYWANNRGSEFVFMLIDKYGPEHPFVQKAKQLVEEANKLDDQLHTFYMALKGNKAKAGSEAADVSADEAEKSLEELAEK